MSSTTPSLSESDFGQSRETPSTITLPVPIIPPSITTIALAAKLELPPIPSHHYYITYNDVLFILPYNYNVGPSTDFYLITRGKRIGVVAQWEKASQFVDGVCGAVFRRVSSLIVGWQLMEGTIDAGQAAYL
ncbi:hypothetical protein BJ138DRAFT_1105183 [Hygrophoropsis aurantiaca]|uniref:Uncharacterized protein n=1 Tax=Hygrophoropsis aurantiaca TaxID=72124 RepID=A0ACB8A037_9AGAM|nr:hypothetical protein BJ138DRAFT_1105183 [Hygrophoropsis aurantiaca]